MPEWQLDNVVYRDDIQRIEISQKDFKLPLSRDIGSFLLSRGLYSKGNDFTCEMVVNNPFYEGNSHLKRLYIGGQSQMYADRNFSDMTFWFIYKDSRLIGLVSHEHGSLKPEMCKEVFHDRKKSSKQQIPVVNLGLVSCFMLPLYRRKGIIKNFVEDFLLPKFEESATNIYFKEKALPYLVAVDATVKLLKPFKAPVVTTMYPSISQSEDLWRCYQHAMDGDYPLIETKPFLIEKSSAQKKALFPIGF